MTARGLVNADRIGRWQPVARAALTPLFRFAWRVKAVGLENLPSKGGVILASNHRSVLDSFFVPLVVRRRIVYVGKAEYLDDWRTRFAFPAMGMIPIQRSGGSAAEAALDCAAAALDEGLVFGIYPEGTRSRTGHLHRGHTGVARLALRSGAPVVPVGLVGTAEVQAPDERWPRLFREVEVRFGEPMWMPQTGATSGTALRSFTDALMFEIAQLSGQTYVDEYAGSGRRVVEETPVGGDRSSVEVLRPRPLVDLGQRALTGS